nr:hypothetical protein [Acidobacteriota bacterium]
AQERAAGDVPRARKIDEFARAHGCDHGARLDNFAIELMNHPDATGHVIAYGPAGEGNGTADYRLYVTHQYLVQMRGIVTERLKLINGGRYKSRDESFVEFWLVPPGAEPPEPSSYRNDVETFKGKFSEYEAWDSFEWGEATGPGTGNSPLAGFADVLRSQPETQAYVVVYHGPESAPGAWRRVADGEVAALKGQGVAGERVRVIFGGYGEKLKIQRWVLPKGAPPPVKDAGPERRTPKAVEVGRMSHYQLRYEDEARAFFRGFAEVLKAEASLSVYLVVRLGAPPPEADLEAAPGVPEEPPDVDPARLAEKWKGELLKEYGINDQRFAVLFVPPREEWGTGEIEAWVVPWGAAPPDPYAAEDEVVEEAEEGNQ